MQTTPLTPIQTDSAPRYWASSQTVQVAAPAKSPFAPESTVAIPNTPDKLVHVISAATPIEQSVLGWRQNNSWPHIRPNSVLVAAMSNHWSPGSWQRVADMIQYTLHAGAPVWLHEGQDRNFNPFDAMGTMRNEAIIEAQNAGFEYLLYIDNDVLPAQDTLIRLLKWDMPIVAPLILEPEIGRGLHGPSREANTGLQPVRWCVLSMLLFKTSVFNCTGTDFWGDPMGADEGFHFKRLWSFGHRPYIDTNTQLLVYGRPHYPLATNRIEQQPGETWDEAKIRTYQKRTETWRDKWASLQRSPNRRPIKGTTQHIQDGEYMPFGSPDWRPMADGATLSASAPSSNRYESEKPVTNRIRFNARGGTRRITGG